MKPYFYPAKIIRYNAHERTAQVSITGLTDGLAEGLTALLAYPIGDDDLDTEREILANADVWVFFENGDQHFPVIAFYRSHGKGRAVVNTRRIRQRNIELLAKSTITLNAGEVANITAQTINITGLVNIQGNINHQGNLTQTGHLSTGQITASGSISSPNVMSDGKSFNHHRHTGVENGRGITDGPM